MDSHAEISMRLDEFTCMTMRYRARGEEPSAYAKRGNILTFCSRSVFAILRDVDVGWIKFGCEHLWNYGRWGPKYSEKKPSQCPFPTTNPTRTSLVSIPSPQGDKPATECLEFLIICVTISFIQLNVPCIYWSSVCFDESFLWLRHHFRNDGSHGICGGESGTELNLIALLLALVFVVFFFHPSWCQTCQPAWRHKLY